MENFLDQCKKYFGSENFYEVLKLKPDASEKNVKKAYYKLSLVVHPDRVDEENKADATEKFKILSKIYYILSDDDKRKIYDENGYQDDDHVIEDNFDWMTFWKSKFKKITVEDIDVCRDKYVGSALEIEDLKKAYMNFEGDMDKILEAVPFTSCEDEPRLIELVTKWIKDGEVPEFKSFTEEPAAKRKRRHRKYEKEKKIVEDSKISDQDLFLALQEKQEERNQKMEALVKKLEEKYTTVKKGRKSLSSSTAGVTASAKSAGGRTSRSRTNSGTVKNGRVSKKKTN